MDCAEVPPARPSTPPFKLTAPVPNTLPPVAVVLTVPPVTPEVWAAAVVGGAPPIVRLVMLLLSVPAVSGLSASTPAPVLVRAKAPERLSVEVPPVSGLIVRVLPAVTSIPLATVNWNWRVVAKLPSTRSTPPRSRTSPGSPATWDCAAPIAAVRPRFASALTETIPESMKMLRP